MLNLCIVSVITLSSILQVGKADGPLQNIPQYCKGFSSSTIILKTIECNAPKNKNHTLAEILNMIPNDTTSLQLNNFNFPTIKYGTFQHMEFLSSLTLHCCKINHIESGAFKGPTLFLNLNLMPNCATINNIGPDTFQPVNTMLGMLAFDKVQHLEVDTFKDFRMLSRLTLGDYTYLDDVRELFKPLSQLMSLTIRDTNMTKIPDFLFETTSGLESIDLSNNKIASLDFRGTVIRRGTMNITLSNNKITKVTNNAMIKFAANPELLLTLSSNRISSIEQGAFRHTRHIEGILLNENYILGSDNIKQILSDIDIGHVSVDSFDVSACGLVVENMNSSFLAPFQYSSLTYLSLASNSIFSIRSDAFKHVPHLRFLYISNFMYISPEALLSLKNLDLLEISNIETMVNPPPERTVIDLNKNSKLRFLRLKGLGQTRITFLFQKLLQLREMRLTDISDDSFEIYREQSIEVLGKVQIGELDFSGDLLFKYTDLEICQLLTNASEVYRIDLRMNFLSHIPNCMFENTLQVEYINLSRNSLTFIQAGLFNHLKNLLQIDLSENAVYNIDPSNFQNILSLPPYRYDTRIKLWFKRNQFSCNCDLDPFKAYLMSQEKNLQYSRNDDERCFLPDRRRNVSITAYRTTWMECKSTVFYTTAACVSGSLVLITTVALIVLKVYWKDIEYKYIVYKAAHKDGYVPLEGEHDAFVSYHPDSIRWVENQLIHKMETGDKIQFRMTYYERFEFGQSLFTSMGEHLINSRKIIFVVTRAWMDAMLNIIELHMALEKLVVDHKMMFIVLLMEDIPRSEMSHELQMIVKHNVCLKWREGNAKAQNNFWRDLRIELGKNRLKRQANTDNREEQA
ncbi:unnamed protein product [Owenia fusiformis]|uniref:TIR domain-containing protein n=1 Tax=Owenia fusiformis TaxID=6347 RepID=A0A8S4N0X2_OWEFU|nr:unnamed protein product [Owenia fusiformis]